MSPVPDPHDDPDKQTDNDITDTPIDVPPFISITSSSESDNDDEDDGGDLHGYQQLPQEPEAGGDDEYSAMSTAPPGDQVTVDDVIRQELAGVHLGTGYSAPSLASTLGLPEDGLPVTESVWKGGVERRDSGPLEQEQADKIKAAMAGFKLPDCQTPDWAKDIPEDVWKSQLKARFNLEPNDQS